MSREDGRLGLELRRAEVTLGAAGSYQGSCLYRQGQTRVLAAAQGPFEVRGRKVSKDSGSVTVSYEGLVCSGSGANRAEFELIIQSILNTALDLSDFPRQCLSVVITPLCDRGGLLAACVNAAVLAALHAGLPFHKFPIAVNLAMNDNSLLVDPLDMEELDCPNITVVQDTVTKTLMACHPGRNGPLTSPSQCVALHGSAPVVLDVLWNSLRPQIAQYLKDIDEMLAVNCDVDDDDAESDGSVVEIGG